MTVLQVFNEYRQKGGEELWADMLPGLAAPEVVIHDLRFRSEDWLGAGAPSKLRQIRLMGDNPEARQRLRECVSDLRPDVLLFHNLIPVASLGLYDEALRLGLPVLQYLHNFRPFSPSGTLWVGQKVNEAALHGNPLPEILAGAWNGSRVKTAILAWHLARLRRSGALDAVKAWLAISQFMLGKFAAAGIPAERLTSLRHCWAGGTAASNFPEDEYYLYLGRLCEEKGVGTLLAAWTRLADISGRRCPKLVIAGEGPMEEAVRRAAGENRQIEYAGFVSGVRKRDLTAACRALLAPSIWWEPLGLIIYEAFAVGCPVISSGAGGMAETVREGDTGFLHSPGDVGQLASAVARMEAIGRDGRRAMGERGRRWLIENAGVGNWKDGFVGVLRRVAAGGGARAGSPPDAVRVTGG
ncbi:MAG: glycosyltransferase [Verrucomicrobia bacterium]|nr:glycosyltransferase [Verrucomicrobiota bacterium]